MVVVWYKVLKLEWEEERIFFGFWGSFVKVLNLGLMKKVFIWESNLVWEVVF